MILICDDKKASHLSKKIKSSNFKGLNDIYN